MEYKLRKSEFYRIAYLVAGILMFLFLFGIFNLSSFADSSGSFSLDSGESVDVTFPVATVTTDYYNVNNYTFPYSTYSYSVSCSSNANLKQSCEIHIVTSTGDFSVAESNSGTSASGTVALSGVPISAYGIFKATNIGSTSQTAYGVATVNTRTVSSTSSLQELERLLSLINTSVDNIESDVDDIRVDVDTINYNVDLIKNLNLFGDYGSFNLLSVSNDVKISNSFGGGKYPTGSPLYFYFPNYNGTSLLFADQYFPNFRYNTDKFIFCLKFGLPSGNTPSFTSGSNLRFLDFASSSDIRCFLSDFTYQWLSNDGSYDYYLGYYVLDLPLLSNVGLYQFNFIADSNISVHSFSFWALEYVASINDYMSYVKDQWNNVQPSVSTTNSNTADSVSTVGSASTYESTQFSNFDNLVTQTGVDTFSLSTVSTPLLWVGGLITSCYNALPSSIQYLLMFVGVFGLICMILNVFGRVTSRIGESDPTKLNKHDVFSKIEKNGSI